MTTARPCPKSNFSAEEDLQVSAISAATAGPLKGSQAQAALCSRAKAARPDDGDCGGVAAFARCPDRSTHRLDSREQCPDLPMSGKTR